MQDKNFETTRQLLFDGESALKLKKVQEEIRKRFNIKIHAEPYWKRSFAERAILVRLSFECLYISTCKVKKNPPLYNFKVMKKSRCMFRTDVK